MQGACKRVWRASVRASLLTAGLAGLAVAPAVAITPPLPAPNVEIVDGGIVNALARAPDGSIYVGGAFTSVFFPGLGLSIPRLGIAKFAPDGTLDLAWEATIENGVVLDIEVDANGDVFASGTFTTVNAFTRRGVVKLVGTGQLAQCTFATTCVAGATCVDSIELDGAGSIYVGGAFSAIGGATRNGLAKVATANCTADATWNPNPSPPLTGISDLELGADDSLFVAGGFTAIGGQARNGLAKLSRSGTGAADATWNPVGAGFGGIQAMTIANGTLYVGGSFSAIGGQTRSGLARLATTGTGAADATWNPGIASNVGTPRIGALRSDGSAVYVAGEFNTVGGLVRANVAKLAGTGAGLADAAFSAAPDRRVADVVPDAGTLHIAGEFRVVNGTVSLGLARLSSGSGALQQVAYVQGAGFINAIVRDIEGSVYVGGRFARVAGNDRIDLVKLQADGSVDPQWNPMPGGSTTFGADVNALAADGAGSLYVGGGFRMIGGLARDYVAKLTTAGTGSADAAWSPAPNGTVRALALDSGALYLGGSFTSVGGVTRNRIARVATATGALDAAWNPSVSGGDNSTKTVYAIVPDPGGSVYFAGQFGTVGGTSRANVAKVAAAGTGLLDATWNPGAGDGSGSSGNTVFAMVRRSDGSIVVGGFFATAGGQPRSNLARLSGTGSGAAVIGWDPAPNGFVLSLAPGPADSLFVGGNFSTIDFSARNAFAKLTPGGLNDFAFDASANSSVTALALGANGNVYVGGLFTVIGGELRDRLAAFTVVPDPIFASGFE